MSDAGRVRQLMPPMNVSCPSRKCWWPSGSRSTPEGVRPKVCRTLLPQRAWKTMGLNRPITTRELAGPPGTRLHRPPPPGRTPARLTEPSLIDQPADHRPCSPAHTDRLNLPPRCDVESASKPSLRTRMETSDSTAQGVLPQLEAARWLVLLLAGTSSVLAQSWHDTIHANPCRQDLGRDL